MRDQQPGPINPPPTGSPLGPAFDERLDGDRISLQHERIRDFMLSQATLDQWVTLGEIAAKTGDPEASISAQLRHLRKARFGSWLVDKRRRYGDLGLWEYRIRRKEEIS